MKYEIYIFSCFLILWHSVVAVGQLSVRATFANFTDRKCYQVKLEIAY
jgi:hypothetical protein